jgi:hypothetical protein
MKGVPQLNAHPLTEAPAVGTEVFIPDITSPNLVLNYAWAGEEYDLTLLERRLIFDNRTYARVAADFLLDYHRMLSQ